MRPSVLFILFALTLPRPVFTNGHGPVFGLSTPNLNGGIHFELIKTDSVLKTIPTVMLTSSREEQDLIESHNLGVNAYVVKPVDFVELVDAVKKLGVFWALINEPPPGSTGKATPH